MKKYWFIICFLIGMALSNYILPQSWHDAIEQAGYSAGMWTKDKLKN